MTKIGLAGLGYWGPNLARNFDELADLAWICDLDEKLLDRFASRYPDARPTTRIREPFRERSRPWFSACEISDRQ